LLPLVWFSGGLCGDALSVGFPRGKNEESDENDRPMGIDI
jgi:hypothetical protein